MAEREATASDPGAAAREWRAGWPVVLASFFGTSLLGVFFFSAGAFFAPLEHEFHWSRGEISASFLIFATVGTLLSPPVGMILDRWGAKRMVVPGAAAVGLSFALLSTLNGSFLQWLGYWLLLSICCQFIMVTVWSAAVSYVFSASRGLALSLSMMGNGVTTIIATPLANYLIEHDGWRFAYRVMGLGWGGLVLVTSFFLLRDRRDHATTVAATQRNDPPASELPGYTVREGVRSAAFIKIFASVLICNLLNIGLVAHLFPILLWDHVPKETAVWITSSFGAAMLAGNFAFGLIGDRLPPKYVTAFLVAAPAVTCAMLLQPTDSWVQRLVAVDFSGFIFGMQMVSYTYLSARYLGMRSFGTLQGIANSGLSIATAISPFIAGKLYDYTGGYAVSLLGGIPLLLLAGLILLTMGRYPQFEPTKAEPVAGEAIAV